MSDSCGTICGVRYRSTSKCVYSAKYQVIWCPKYRRRVIGGRVEICLKEIINEVVAECGGQVIQLETAGAPWFDTGATSIKEPQAAKLADQGGRRGRVASD